MKSFVCRRSAAPWQGRHLVDSGRNALRSSLIRAQQSSQTPCARVDQRERMSELGSCVHEGRLRASARRTSERFLGVIHFIAHLFPDRVPLSCQGVLLAFQHAGHFHEPRSNSVQVALTSQRKPAYQFSLLLGSRGSASRPGAQEVGASGSIALVVSYTSTLGWRDAS